jgi:hypothetical protein
MRSLLLALAVGTCGCIPVKKTYVTWPGRTLRVSDGKGAIEGAKVRVVRVEHPYSREVDTRTFESGPAGEVKLVEEKTTKTVFPLMMHGVPGYSFRACAEAPGHASASAEWWDDGSKPVELKLPRGSRPCVFAKAVPPEAGRMRLDAIDVRDGEWQVDLAIGPEQELAVDAQIADGSSKLTVRKILFRSPPEAPLPRVQVLARGDGSSWKYGDSIDP